MSINSDRLLQQLKDDEGFISHAKWDNKQWSYGYGCRAPGENATITEPEATELLKSHMTDAIDHFNRIFKGHEHKFNDVRAEAFINMIFNMGPGRKGDPGAGGLQSFVNTLKLISNNKEVPWSDVAKNLKQSLWYRQVGDRAKRIVRQVETGVA